MGRDALPAVMLLNQFSALYKAKIRKACLKIRLKIKSIFPSVAKSTELKNRIKDITYEKNK